MVWHSLNLSLELLEDMLYAIKLQSHAKFCCSVSFSAEFPAVCYIQVRLDPGKDLTMTR